MYRGLDSELLLDWPSSHTAPGEKPRDIMINLNQVMWGREFGEASQWIGMNYELI
jgi:hypothetical protein